MVTCGHLYEEGMSKVIGDKLDVEKYCYQLQHQSPATEGGTIPYEGSRKELKIQLWETIKVTSNLLIFKCLLLQNQRFPAGIYNGLLYSDCHSVLFGSIIFIRKGFYGGSAT